MTAGEENGSSFSFDRIARGNLPCLDKGLGVVSREAGGCLSGVEEKEDSCIDDECGKSSYILLKASSSEKSLC